MVWPGKGKEKAKKKKDLEELEEEVTKYKGALKFIHDTILSDAVRSREESFKFDGEGWHLSAYDRSTDGTKALVRVLVDQLVKQIDSANWWAHDYFVLEKEHDNLVFQTQGGDVEAIQRHRTKRAGAKEIARDRIKDLENRLGQAYIEIASYEAEKDRLLTRNSVLQGEHDRDMQLFADDCEKRRIAMQRSHDQEKQALEPRIKRRVLDEYASERKATEDRHIGEMKKLRTKYDIEMDSLKAELAIIGTRHEGEIARLREDHKGKKAELKQQLANEISQHESEVRDMEQQHSSTIQQMDQAREVELQRKQQDHEAKIRTMTQEQESARSQWIQTESRLIRDHNSQMKTLRKEHEDAVDHILKEHKAECRTMNDQIAKMKKDHAAELLLRKSEFDEEKVELLQQHADEKKQIEKDRDAYSAALLERDKARDKVTGDKFEELKDVEIKAKYQELKDAVEKLARLDWRSDQAQPLRRLFPAQSDTLMRQILQDSIWVVLHKHIFCSPFRILGEEGQRLETQWNKEYGKDSAFDNGSYIWPKPEVETERWRYTPVHRAILRETCIFPMTKTTKVVTDCVTRSSTVKECRSALRKPASQWDPRAKLKKDFADALEKLKTELAETLSEVTDKSDKQAVKEVTMKATNMWLEFGMQRFRLLVVVQDSKFESIEDRVRRSQEDVLELVLVPGLKSFGNSKGQDLQAEETIGDFRGDVIKIKGPPRRG
ncbi:uncharacterized protein PAC_14085 [Phialocephala subalpina]|uniref:Uncharacterized protein n=1 Tax=Phialocephala subalpina TaxID=576137 RepID=A0A1L7XGQ1_9HELO|nr:uncharacterized protein PAC_14085 [Phialocephala subalpina]